MRVARAHGSIVLIGDRCTSCMICVRECPNWCIEIDSHQEVIGDPTSRRPRVGNVLDDFRIDWGLCMFCGICVDACPFEALAWRTDPILPADSALGLVHDMPMLADRSGPGGT